MVALKYNMILVQQEKLKEKKPTLTEALTQTLQAMYKSGCLNLADIVEGNLYFPAHGDLCLLWRCLVI